ncbi:MAG: hypothetical protein EAZ20_08300 [Bacteroidetes bacterium]|nr:MAG: hypothetical protein EAZ20_08300 [Bacteroidota bacterium]
MYLLENTPETDEMIKNIIQLLNSEETENQTLALQLIKGGGFPKKLYVLIWWIAFQRNGAYQNTYTYVTSLSVQQTCFELIKSLNEKDLIPQNFNNKELYYNLNLFLCEYFDKILQVEGFLLEDFLTYILPHYHHLEKKEKNNSQKWITKRIFLQKFWDASHISKKNILEKIISDNKTTLNLDYLQIDSLPEEVFDLHSLKSISFKGTQIEVIPTRLKELPNLERVVYDKTPLAKGGKFLKYLEKNLPKIAARKLYDKIGLNNHWNYENNYKNFLQTKNKNILIKVLELWDTFPDALLTMAKIYKYSEEEKTKANFYYQKLLENYPDWNKYSILNEYFNFLNVTRQHLFLIETFEILLPVFSAHLSQMPQYVHVNIWFYKALAYFWLKEYEQCLEANFYALKVSDYAGTYYNIACAYSKMFKKDEMLEYLEKALKKNKYHYYEMATQDEDKDFEYFKDDKDFQELVRKYK